MNESTNRGLLVAGLCANVLFLMIALLDFALAESRYMWPIFVGWAFVILLMVTLALVASGIRVQVAAPEPARRSAPEPAAPKMAFVPALIPETSLRIVQAVAAPAGTPAKASGPFTYGDYTLYSQQVELKNGGVRPIYFFSKRKPASGLPIAKPAGFHVGVNERTGLPFLKKGAGADGEDLTPEVEEAYRPQCSALTEEGHQCRNSSRGGSKYCSSHFGYQPTTIAKAEARREDTLPRVKGAPDTLPSVRKKVIA